MKTKKFFLLCAVMVFVFTVSSCKDDGGNRPEPPIELPECEGVDTSGIDFSNIENLYEQPLCIIKKCVQGKWEFLGGWNSVFAGTIYSGNTFVEIDIKNNNVVITGDGNKNSNGAIHNSLQGLSSVSWEFKEVYMGHTKPYCSTFVMLFNDKKTFVPPNRPAGWIFDLIRNDTLNVIFDFTPGFYEVYSFLRIKE